MSHTVAIEKRAFGAAGAVTAALVEAGLSPATALLRQIADLAETAGLMSGLPALGLALAILAGVALAAVAYARPLSRKAAFATGFCAIAVLALLAP